MTNGEDRLAGYIKVWAGCVDDVVGLLEQLPPEQWAVPTDLVGWDVHDVAAHLAHLEHVLAGGQQDTVEIGEPPHVKNPLGRYTEQGVVARKNHSPQELIAELREAATKRQRALVESPPRDPKDKPSIGFPGLDWDWQTLLSNRVIDMWLHEQDIRRAVARPGNLDSPGADHTVHTFAKALGAVIARRAGATPGTTVLVSLAEGDQIAYRVDDSGRATAVSPPPQQATVRITTGREEFTCLAGGRRSPDRVGASIEGDTELAARILSKLVVTP